MFRGYRVIQTNAKHSNDFHHETQTYAETCPSLSLIFCEMLIYAICLKFVRDNPYVTSLLGWLGASRPSVEGASYVSCCVP